jgi:hypothetical protein
MRYLKTQCWHLQQEMCLQDPAVLQTGNVYLVLLTRECRKRNGRIPDLYNSSNTEGKERGSHASDVHCAAIFF